MGASEHNYIEIFYVGDRPLFTRSGRDIVTNNEAVYRPLSVAFLCPRCGHIWARRFIYGQDWQARIALCADHGGGSLVENDFEFQHLTDPYLESHFPYEWLLHELAQLKPQPSTE